MNTRWEYKVLTLKSETGFAAAFNIMPKDDEATAILNREGAQGWELVGTAFNWGHPSSLFFKRPL